MLFPFAFIMPVTYLTLRQAAVMRHAAVGMSPCAHRVLMRLVYGL